MMARESKKALRTRSSNLRGSQTLFSSIDVYVMLACVLLLLSCGFLFAFSASFPKAAQQNMTPFKILLKQIVALGIGVISFLLFYYSAKAAYIRKFSVIFYLFSLVFMFFTLVAGVSKYGAARWIVIGPVNFQPSEVFKLSFILFLGHMLLGKKKNPREAAYWGYGIIIFSALLVFLQRDMTTAVIFLASGLILMYLSYLAASYVYKIILPLFVAGIIGVMLEGYRMQRIIIFLDPWKAGESGRQVVVSLTALAQGGISGVGIGRSIFKYNVLPAAHTDFIFAIIGSELGLVGSLSVIFLLLILFISGVRISNKIKDEYGRLVSLSLIAMMAIQAIINIGGTVQLLPPTGVPLPFVSLGGTSLVVNLAIVGLICGFASRSGKKNEDTGIGWRNERARISSQRDTVRYQEI